MYITITGRRSLLVGESLESFGIIVFRILSGLISPALRNYVVFLFFVYKLNHTNLFYLLYLLMCIRRTMLYN